MYRRFMTISLAAFFVISLTNLSSAQRSVGKVNKDTKIADPNLIDIPIEQWIGKRFVFLEQRKKLQKYGYSDFSESKVLHSLKNLKYSDYVGRVIRVVDVGQEDYSFRIITFVEEKSNKKIYAEAYNGCIRGIALLDEIEKAKKKWMGKTVYSKARKILTYNEKLDKYGEVKVKIGEPLKVVDIFRGFAWENNRLWVVVRTQDAKEGFIKTRFSWTNSYTDEWTDKRPWEDELFGFNPRVKYKWSEEIWGLINNGKIRIGMNQEQVRLSWGKPQEINKDIYGSSVHEQWIYGEQYLYFEGGKLTAMQNL